MVRPTLRADGTWSLLIVNRGTVGGNAAIGFKGASAAAHGPLHVLQYSAQQYAWEARLGHPSLDLPPEEKTVASWDADIALRGLALTVVSGAGPTSAALQ